MLRQKWGSVVCPGCNNLVGVQDDRCMTCGRWNPGMWGFGPALTRLGRDLGFTPFIITVCIFLYGATLLFDRAGIQTSGILNMLSPAKESLFVFGASGAVPIFGYGRWWTVLTAGWLHGGVLHILFNMMAVRNVAPIVVDFYGASRTAIIYIFSGITGFAASSLIWAYGPRLPFLSGARLTVGASAAIAGLIGAIYFYGRRTGHRHAGDQAKQWIFYLLIFGFVVQGIDNWAHIGGLAGGYLCAKILDPLYPERIDHLLIALGLLIATAIAFAVSITQGLRLL
ncbi:MAG TPA: rhomboid family intramembrane serine protease [Terriglobia bacterium]|nr:rhomboid family intramembrane serine protease [Terriglobia bacterium]